MQNNPIKSLVDLTAQELRTVDGGSITDTLMVGWDDTTKLVRNLLENLTETLDDAF